jgi:hypothetical protein
MLNDILRCLVNELKELNGLIIIHPDYSTSNAEYIKHLVFASFFCNSMRIPVLAIPNDSLNPLQGKYPDKILDLWENLPDTEYYEPGSSLEIISEKAQTPISRLRLGFGGIAYDGCVLSYAIRTCVKVRGPKTKLHWYDGAFAQPLAAYGKVFEEICIAEVR